MRKALSVMETSILVVVIVAVIAGIAIFLNSTSRTSMDVKYNLKLGTINLKTMSDAKAKEKVVYELSQTAGIAALKELNMKFGDFQKVVENMTYANLKKASEEGSKAKKDIFSLTNNMIDKLHLDYHKVSPETVDRRTLTTFIGILNISSTIPKTNTLSVDANEYIAAFKALANKVDTSADKTPVVPPTPVKAIKATAPAPIKAPAKAPVPVKAPVKK